MKKLGFLFSGWGLYAKCEDLDYINRFSYGDLYTKWWLV